jgi:hypothetical protein
MDTRTPADGFKGEYPAPLDWGRIIEELSAGTDTDDNEESSTLNP